MGGDSQFQAPITGVFTAAAQVLDLSSPNSGTSVIQVTGTWSGVILLECSNDNSTWISLSVLKASTKAFYSSIIENSFFIASTNGFQYIRLRTSTFVSGSASINVWGSDSASLLFSDVLLRDAAGVVLGTSTNPIYTNGNSEILSPLPSVSIFHRAVHAVNQTMYATQTLSTNTAIKFFYVGGRVACEGSIAKYIAAATSGVSAGGGFNSIANVSNWTNTSVGNNATGSNSWSYTTAQAYEGTGSAAMTFTSSNTGSYTEITYVYGTAQDWSLWRYISAQVRVTVAAGGSTARTAELRVKSGTAIRIWNITGTTTTAPFSTEQWLQILGELESPTTTAGSGTFDINNINEISLRMYDGANKSGTVYWDDIRLIGSLDIKGKIYSANGETRELVFDPVITFNASDVVALILRNNSASVAEMQIAASGVDIT